jgi:uncharacterized delta-60 repeat protein
MNIRHLLAMVGLAAVCGCAFANDSDLDTTFGTNGVARAGITDDSGGVSACNPVFQADGKILLCGSRLNNGGTVKDFFVARFTADGQLDPSFSFDGRVTIDFDAGAGFDTATSLAVQADGKIVVVGSTAADLGANHDDFAIARLNSDGTLDTSFGGGTGKKIVAFNLNAGEGNDDASDVAIQADGKIVVVGAVATATHGRDFGVLRLLSDGTPDPAFNLSGKVNYGFDLGGSFDDIPTRVAIDSSGRIVVSGSATSTPGVNNTDFAIMRLMPNGQLDANFDADGRATVAFDIGMSASDGAYGLALQADGKILLSGNVDVSPTASANPDIGIVRLQPDGSLDSAFGIGGKTLATFDLVPDGTDYGLAITQQPDGRIVIAGASLYTMGEGNLIGTAVRLLADGSPDDSFGVLGKRTYNFGLTDPGSQAFLGVTARGTDLYVSGIAVVPGVTNPIDVFIARLRNDTIFENGFDSAP